MSGFDIGDKVWFIAQIFGTNELRGRPYRGIISEMDEEKVVVRDHECNHLCTFYGSGMIDVSLFNLIDSEYITWKFNNPVDMTIPTKQSMFQIMRDK